ncbi:MAG: alpha-ribazole phosphatase CobZ [Candidatus Helarchaeota archaeon]
MTEKKLKSCIGGIEISISEQFTVVKSSKPLNILSSAVLNGGIAKSKYIINHYVDKNYDHKNPEVFLLSSTKKIGLDETSVGLMTAVKMKNCVVENYNSEKFQITTIVTGGTTNSIQVGQNIEKNPIKAGTINIIVIINGNLSPSAVVTMVQVITEAKMAALLDIDVRSRYGGYATGTTTDSVLVAWTEFGKDIKYSGTATEIGREVGKLIKQSVKKAIIKGDDINPQRAMVLRLKERGINLDELIETALEMYVPHPGIETKEKAKICLEKILKKVLKDSNIASLLMAAFRIQEDGERGLIPGITQQDFAKDPVFIIADEIIGIAISNYIAGTRGIFEFYRFDREKPGILKKLGVFLDDCIGGLIAGVSSLMYSEEITFEDV